MIERAWEAQKAIKEVMLFLRGHNVSINVHDILEADELSFNRSCLSVRSSQ
jgi:hypothetical protein